MPHQNRAVQLDGERRHVRPRGIGVREDRVEIGNHLLIQLVRRFDWKLSVRERLAVLGSEAKHRPRDLIAGLEHCRQLTRGSRARLHRVDRRRVEARTRARDLICQIHGTIAADEVLIPPHAPVRRRLPCLAAQTTAVHHHDRYVTVAIGRNLILHVHLVDGDLATSRRASPSTLRRCGQRLLLASHEEAPLLRDHEGLLQILSARRLSRARRRRGDHYRNGNAERRQPHGCSPLMGKLIPRTESPVNVSGVGDGAEPE